ncbi:MAG: flagellar export chaperone FliS [Desulfurivibrio sp.]|nr:flagellar export chaperone FliS [Desulfurivibrio sp.]
MYSRQGVQAYRRNEVSANVHPVKLVHMMYERVLTHLRFAEEAIGEGDVRKRGENLSKAIALIAELNAAVNSEDKSEAASFLRGLYGAILVELPQASVNNDVEILRQAGRYISELKKVWEETAMRENGLDERQSEAMQPSSEAERVAPLSVSI